ncbi:hypothetical protein EV363DRAFT_468109 [Boletus edulis]|nr:hypothetical protein EV363DRAFT_468109 [Boletus edulis]
MVPKAPSRDRIHGTHKGSADADNIPAKPMIPMSRHTCSRSDEYQHHRCYRERTSRCVAAGRGRPFGAHSLTQISLLRRAIVPLDTFVTDYFLLCKAIVPLDTLVNIMDYFLLCRAIVLLDTFVTDSFLFCRAIVPLDTVITITSWTTCDSNPDDRLGTGTSILGTS